MILFIRFTLGWSDLLNGSSRWQHGAKILNVYLVELLQVRDIVQVNIRGHNLLKTHVCLLEVIEEVAHRLTELMLCGRGVDSSVRPGDEAILGGTIQGIAGKDARTRGRAGWHVLRPDGLSLPEITNRNSRVLDMRTTGQTRHFDCCPCRGVAKFESPGVALVHNLHWNIRRQVGIDEHHVTKFETSRPHDRLQAIESKINLRRGIVRDFPIYWIAARHV